MKKDSKRLYLCRKYLPHFLFLILIIICINFLYWAVYFPETPSDKILNKEYLDIFKDILIATAITFYISNKINSSSKHGDILINILSEIESKVNDLNSFFSTEIEPQNGKISFDKLKKVYSSINIIVNYINFIEKKEKYNSKLQPYSANILKGIDELNELLTSETKISEVNKKKANRAFNELRINIISSKFSLL